MPRVRVPTSVTAKHVDMTLYAIQKGRYTDQEIGAALSVHRIVERFLAGTQHCHCTLTRIRQEIEFYEKAIESRRKPH